MIVGQIKRVKRGYNNSLLYKTFKVKKVLYLQNVWKDWAKSMGGTGLSNRAVYMVRATDWSWAEITNEVGRTIRFEVKTEWRNR